LRTVGVPYHLENKAIRGFLCKDFLLFFTKVVIYVKKNRFSLHKEKKDVCQTLISMQICNTNAKLHKMIPRRLSGTLVKLAGKYPKRDPNPIRITSRQPA
jgi:hypothetical protein